MPNPWQHFSVHLFRVPGACRYAFPGRVMPGGLRPGPGGRGRRRERRMVVSCDTRGGAAVQEVVHRESLPRRSLIHNDMDIPVTPDPVGETALFTCGCSSPGRSIDSCPDNQTAPATLDRGRSRKRGKRIVFAEFVNMVPYEGSTVTTAGSDPGSIAGLISEYF